VNREGGPGSYRPQDLRDDNIREINAMSHIMNELIDEACGRVLARVAARGWEDDTDVFFTTDHGELQGDFGFAFKGPFHTDALMRLPLVWRPAPSAGVKHADLSDPVGHVDLAPTFCAIAGVEAPEWMQGSSLPTDASSGRERALCEWDSQFPGYGMHMRTIYRDDYLCTAYEKSTKGEPNGLEPFLELMHMDPQSSVEYDGSEGELYNVVEDPFQFRNLWGDPDYRTVRDQLAADLFDSLPPAHEPRLLVERPA
jgi:arylsulfatase A-like enzyme